MSGVLTKTFHFCFFILAVVTRSFSSKAFTVFIVLYDASEKDSSKLKTQTHFYYRVIAFALAHMCVCVCVRAFL